MSFIFTLEVQRHRKKESGSVLLDTFLPIGMRTEVFYLEHFGILDMEETMVIDKTFNMRDRQNELI